MARTIVYRELHGYLWAALGLFGVAVAAVVASSLLDRPLGGGLVVLGVVCFLVAGMAEGVHRMNCITLTPARLVVGRDSFTRRDVDALFGVQPSVLLDPGEQARVEDDWPVDADSSIRIAGGGWGRRRGTRLVLVRETTTQDLVAIFSRDPAALDRHLETWMQAIPDRPPDPDPSGPGSS